MPNYQPTYLEVVKHVHLPVLIAPYSYVSQNTKSVFILIIKTWINVANIYFKILRSDIDPNMPVRLLRP